MSYNSCIYQQPVFLTLFNYLTLVSMTIFYSDQTVASLNLACIVSTFYDFIYYSGLILHRLCDSSKLPPFQPLTQPLPLLLLCFLRLR